MAYRRGVEVFTTFCESHATDVPFRVVARLLRVATGIPNLYNESLGSVSDSYKIRNIMLKDAPSCTARLRVV